MSFGCGDRGFTKEPPPSPLLLQPKTSPVYPQTLGPLFGLLISLPEPRVGRLGPRRHVRLETRRFSATKEPPCTQGRDCSASPPNSGSDPRSRSRRVPVLV